MNNIDPDAIRTDDLSLGADLIGISHPLINS